MKTSKLLSNGDIRAARSIPKQDIPLEMSKGMQDLLESHSFEELWFLNEKLGMPYDSNVQAIIKEKLRSREDYKNVLSHIWEGIITEHLKANGRHVRQHKDNPRYMLFKHWYVASPAGVYTYFCTWH